MKLALFRVATLVLGLIAGLALTELVLAVLDVRPPASAPKRWFVRADGLRYYHCYPDNPRGELEPFPAHLEGGPWKLFANTVPLEELPIERLRDTPWVVEYRRNASGWRDVERPLEPSPGVFRIGLVGDSFTFGEGVAFERTLFRRLEQGLGKGHEVLDLGVPGAALSDEVPVVKRALEDAHCGLVLLIFVPNDVALSPALKARETRINDLVNVRQEYLAAGRATAWSAPLRSVQLVRSFFEMRRIERETVQWYLDSYEPAHNAENLKVFERQLSAVAAAGGNRVALVLYPLLIDIDGRYPLAPVHETVLAMARRVGLRALDLAPVFAAAHASSESLWVHPVDHHPNGAAHALAARALQSWIERELKHP